MSLSIPFHFRVDDFIKVARVEGNLSLAFLHCIGIALHPSPFVFNIVIFVLKGDVKLQITNFCISVVTNHNKLRTNDSLFLMSNSVFLFFFLIFSFLAGSLSTF